MLQRKLLHNLKLLKVLELFVGSNCLYLHRDRQSNNYLQRRWVEIGNYFFFSAHHAWVVGLVGSAGYGTCSICIVLGVRSCGFFFQFFFFFFNFSNFFKFLTESLFFFFLVLNPLEIRGNNKCSINHTNYSALFMLE